MSETQHTINLQTFPGPSKILLSMRQPYSSLTPIEAHELARALTIAAEMAEEANEASGVHAAEADEPPRSPVAPEATEAAPNRAASYVPWWKR